MWLVSLAWGQTTTAPPDAEIVRLREEIVRLAQKNAWAGVERLYGDLVAMDAVLPCDVHLYAAEAAKSDGRATLAFRRLQRMTQPDPNAEPSVLTAWETGQQEIATLGQQFRFVAIHVASPAPATLERPEPPFAQLERDAITRAAEVLAQTRTFRGLLPVGSYFVGGEQVTVEAGGDWQVIAIGFK
ncbi:MAG: hypothetical protein H6738_21040 [Alphaproteobacteria bacterium]|nr:hypothetical protein [Alphaproteobacteria bacterium]MCB9699280.1 hypothetical protein [Alphaproteobacteria bacterium]